MKPYSSAVLALCGVALIGVGAYFIFFRPVLLPEDARYIGASLPQLQATAPNLLQWLNRVFWVLGGYVLTAGVLTLYVARTSFRKRADGVSVLIALVGLTSIGWMTFVNFIIQSDFKWLLFGLAGLWGISLMLFWIEGKGLLERRQTMGTHTDPVCGMKVDEKDAAAQATYLENTYYFCSSGCKKKFDENPETYASTEGGS